MDRKGKRLMKKPKREITPPPVLNDTSDSDLGAVEGDSDSGKEITPEMIKTGIRDAYPSGTLKFVCPNSRCQSNPLSSRSHLLRHCKAIHGWISDDGYWVYWGEEKTLDFKFKQAKAQQIKRKNRQIRVQTEIQREVQRSEHQQQNENSLTERQATKIRGRRTVVSALLQESTAAVHQASSPQPSTSTAGTEETGKPQQRGRKRGQFEQTVASQTQTPDNDTKPLFTFLTDGTVEITDTLMLRRQFREEVLRRLDDRPLDSADDITRYLYLKYTGTAQEWRERYRGICLMIATRKFAARRYLQDASLVDPYNADQLYVQYQTLGVRSCEELMRKTRPTKRGMGHGPGPDPRVQEIPRETPHDQAPGMTTGSQAASAPPASPASPSLTPLEPVTPARRSTSRHRSPRGPSSSKKVRPNNVLGEDTDNNTGDSPRDSGDSS